MVTREAIIEALRQVQEPELGIPFLGRIPIDPEVRAGGDRGTPLVVADPGSATAEAFRQVTSKIAARISVVKLVSASVRGESMAGKRAPGQIHHD